MSGHNHIYVMGKVGLLVMLAGVAGGCATSATVTGYVGEGAVSSSSIAIDPAGYLPDNFRPLEQVRIVAALVGAGGKQVAIDTYHSRSDGEFALVVGPRSWLSRLLGKRPSYRLGFHRMGYESVVKYVRLPLAPGRMLFCLLKPAPTPAS